MIKNLKLEDIEKNKIIKDMQKTTRENNDLYGEVFTPFNLINHGPASSPCAANAGASRNDPNRGRGLQVSKSHCMGGFSHNLKMHNTCKDYQRVKELDKKIFFRKRLIT